MRYCSALKELTILLFCPFSRAGIDGGEEGKVSKTALSQEEASTLTTFTKAILPYVPKTVSQLTLSFQEDVLAERGTSPLLENWLLAENCERVEKKMLHLAAVQEINIVIGLGEQVVSARVQRLVISAFPALHKTGKLRFPGNHRIEW